MEIIESDNAFQPVTESERNEYEKKWRKKSKVKRRKYMYT